MCFRYKRTSAVATALAAAPLRGHRCARPSHAAPQDDPRAARYASRTGATIRGLNADCRRIICPAVAQQGCSSGHLALADVEHKWWQTLTKLPTCSGSSCWQEAAIIELLVFSLVVVRHRTRANLVKQLHKHAGKNPTTSGLPSRCPSHQSASDLSVTTTTSPTRMVMLPRPHPRSQTLP